MAFPPYIPDTDDAASTVYLLTSREELQRLVSQSMENLHTDDLDTTNIEDFDTDNLSDVNKTNFLNETIQRVSSEIMSYLMPRYLVEHVYRIPSIRRIATYWLAYYVSMRRGNEPLYEREYFDGKDELIDYRDGVRWLDAPVNGQRAIVQSYLHDNRFTRHPIRVVADGSTTTKTGQHLSILYAFSWL